MFNYSCNKSLDTTALQSTMNMTQNHSQTPFSQYSCNQIYDHENTLINSIAYPNSQITQKRHHRIASQMRQKLNSLIFEVQENAFHKAKVVQTVQEVNYQLVDDLKNRKVPSFGVEKSFNFRETVDQGYSNFGSVYKHSHTQSDIPFSILIDQTSFHENQNISQNIRGSNFNKGKYQEEDIGDIKQALNQEMKKNQMLNYKFYHLERQNQNLRDQNSQSIRLLRQNENLKREIKNYSTSDVSIISTQKILHELTQLKQNGQYLRQQTNNFVQRMRF